MQMSDTFKVSDTYIHPYTSSKRIVFLANCISYEVTYEAQKYKILVFVLKATFAICKNTFFNSRNHFSK